MTKAAHIMEKLAKNTKVPKAILNRLKKLEAKVKKYEKKAKPIHKDDVKGTVYVADKSGKIKKIIMKSNNEVMGKYYSGNWRIGKDL